MSQLIKTINSRIRIEFDKGKFDEWCVYIISERKCIAPRDADYFSILRTKSCQHGRETIYEDFVNIYSQTNKTIDCDLLNKITEISVKYESDAEEMNKWFTVLYAGMVAEENKRKTKLGKRIKRLGMHQLLIENREPEEAANFSKNKSWKELDRIMKERGF